ncbi:hypothetical protein E3P84_01015 [Wallemia ichthyophaga]|nr:hypothetical protein E3P84_01015 [Wallemia ichthyophaga]TIB42804.1 hypothetical protein E3P83_01060 [Wallemia ichthyophaga]
MPLINSLNGEPTRLDDPDDNSLILDGDGFEVDLNLHDDSRILYLFNRHQLKSFHKDNVKLYSTPLDSLNDYISAARFHFEHSQHLHAAAINRHNSITVALLYIKRQIDLLESLRSDFDSTSTTLLSQHAELLHHHQFHMHLISSIPVNPKLVKNRSRYLSDYMSIQKMDQIYSHSLDTHIQHHHQHQLLDELWVDIDNELQDIEMLLQAVNFSEFDNALTEAADAFDSTSQLNMSQREHLDQLDAFLREDVITLTNLKNSQPHLEYLTRLSHIHVQLSDIPRRTTNLKHSIGTLSSFQHLTRLKAMPTAYVSLIAELARRNAFDSHYKEKTSDIAELLANESRKEEIRRLTLVDFDSVASSTSTAKNVALSEADDYMKVAAVKPARFLPFDVAGFDSMINMPEVNLRGGNLPVRITADELEEVVQVVKRAVEEYGMEREVKSAAEYSVQHSVERPAIDTSQRHIDTSAIIPLFSVYESTLTYIHALDVEWEKKASAILLPQSTKKMRVSHDIDQLRREHEGEVAKLRKTHADAMQQQKEEHNRTASELASKEEVSVMRTRIGELEQHNEDMNESVAACARTIRARDETIEELKRNYEEQVTVRDQELRHIRSEMDADHAVLSRHLELASHELARKGDDAADARAQHKSLADNLAKVLARAGEKDRGSAGVGVGVGVNNVLLNFSSTFSHTPQTSHTSHPPITPLTPHTQHPDDLVSRVAAYVRRWQKEAKVNRERAKEKLAFRNFGRGDLALFLPTRNAAAKPWAAFNISFPHYFLKPTPSQSETLKSREWTVARITNIDEKIVDGTSDNPFGLGIGVKYFLLDVDIWQPKHRRGPSRSGGGGDGGGLSVVVDDNENERERGSNSTQPHTHNHTPSNPNPFSVVEGGGLDSPCTRAGTANNNDDDNSSAAERRMHDRDPRRRTGSATSSATSSRTRSSVSQQPPPNLLSQSPGVTTTLTRALSEQKEKREQGPIEEARSSVSPGVNEHATTSRDGRSRTVSVTGAAQDLLRNSLKRQQQHSPTL